jgi:hypothetical protein
MAPFGKNRSALSSSMVATMIGTRPQAPLETRLVPWVSDSFERPEARAVPSRTPLTVALGLSSALIAASAIAGLVSVLVPSVFRDPAAYAGNALGTYVVILLVALPVMAVSMRASSRGSLRGRFVWLGCLGYLTYNAAIASFSLRFNELFLLYVASLSLGVWSLVAVLRCVDVAHLPLFVSRRLPAQAIGAYLAATAVSFAALWLSDVIPATLSGATPASLHGTVLPTNAVHVLDFAFTLPLCMLGGVWIWRRRPWGILLAGAMLVMLELEAVSVATDQYFGHRADPSQSAAAVPLFIALAVIGALPLLAFMRSVVRSHR